MGARTLIEADPQLPLVRIERDFDAPLERVFRAWTDPEWVTQWLGPYDTTVRIDEWDARTGGSYRYAAVRGGDQIASFYGSFHEVRPNSRLVQTFTFTGVPDGVSLETMTFTELDDGRTRSVGIAVVESLAARDAMLASGMEIGVRQGYTKLAALLVS